MEVIPECWTKTAEYKAAVTQAESLMASLISMPEELQLESEIDYLENQIDNFKQKISDLEPECEKIFQMLKGKNDKAYIIARLHYSQGLKWDDIAYHINSTPEAARMYIYRVLASFKKKDPAIW